MFGSYEGSTAAADAAAVFLLSNFPRKLMRLVISKPVIDLVATQLENDCRLLFSRMQITYLKSTGRELFEPNRPSEVRVMQTVLLENIGVLPGIRTGTRE